MANINPVNNFSGIQPRIEVINSDGTRYKKSFHVKNDGSAYLNLQDMATLIKRAGLTLK